jgi:hypothetical protein
MYSDLKYLEVPLPEDIQKIKWYGDFNTVKKIIDRRLQADIPSALKKRLELEKEIISRIPEQYPYTWEQAEEILHKNIRDFKDEELETFWQNNMAEWIYINGKVHFHSLFLENLFKTRPYLAERDLHPENENERTANFRLLDQAVNDIKTAGKLQYYFRIRSSIKISEQAQRIGEKVQVHIPVPVEYAQVKNFKLLSTSLSPFYIASSDYPQRTICFETVLQKNQTFSAEYEFETHMVYQNPDPSKVFDAQPTFYTEELAPHIHFTPYLKMLAEEITGRETNALIKARRIYDYITTHILYSFVRSYSTIEDITSYAAAGLKGDCGIQALLFITLCRIAGIPARWQAGLYATPLHAGSHDWAQFYIAPYGWLFADCSFGGAAKRNGAEERWNYYFGNLDPFRIPLAADFQHDFAVPGGHMRNDPYDNQNGEVSYSDKNLTTEEFISETKALQIKKI